MGIATAISSTVKRLVGAVVGQPTVLPREVILRYPELSMVRWRRGGLPVRVGGWCLGQSTVAAITLWRTIWLAPGLTPSPELLLHEFRHVGQFEENILFPILYLWESARRGYVRNRFEVDARAYAATRARESYATHV